MKKKLLALLLVLVMVMSVVPTVSAAGSSFDLQITPSVTEAYVGDTVSYTVTANGTNLNALSFNLVIPEGMTFVAESGKTPDNLAKTLGWAAADWTEAGLLWTGYNDVGTNFPKDVVLMTFTCTVEAVGSLEVSITELVVSDGDFEELDPATQCTLKFGAVAATEGPCKHIGIEYASDDNATCTEDGTKSGVCPACNEKITVANEGSALGHDVTEVAATATCTEAGHSGYYVCSRCDAWFKDATCSVEITDKDSVNVGTLAHTDEDADYYCDVCGTELPGKPATPDEPATPDKPEADDKEEEPTVKPETDKEEEPTVKPETDKEEEPTVKPETDKEEEPTVKPETDKEEEPTQKPNTDEENAQMGDTGMTLYIAMMVVALFGLCGTVILGKKKFMI